ncbi:methyltransferase [Aliidiomarina minuta]|uniref:Methyltransferase n=1 Tax=Aliidiomarina minuta TaxID=880057 RepID=A0A432W3E4_9GAMM|nr:class I SAM-dependent methyltransferase [Aliidiomarina minuta]RUO23852.1 methyltransferase [Aliidiomarina minuta]
MLEAVSCGLCQSQDVELWHTDNRGRIAKREFYRCNQCQLIFVPPEFRLSAEEERDVYQLHQNDPNDPGYRKFLSRTFESMQALLAPGAEGLDFGSGPGPTLSLMFKEAGFSCQDYDIFYAHHPELLATQYDFITATEVFEHLGDPAQVLKQLLACLKPGGLLAIMTQRPQGKDAFSRWRYPMDPTHISFFSAETFDWIRNHWQLNELYRGKDVVILQRN